jgi:DNA-binding NtrC family response regulator
VDDVTFAARRASSAAPRQESDPDVRFRTLVQSPLRAGILRFLCARPTEQFDAEAVMQAFGRMRLDVENCLKELVECGVVRRVAGEPVIYTAARLDPTSALWRLLDTFLERRAAVGIEDSSPSVLRFREMIGRDEKMLAIFEWIRTAAKSDISVLILGPTGSGKEVVARMIHELSRRGPERFQAVNCAALPDTLFESEIFGYEKGAFTGAHERKPGRLELDNGGTLFLDEIGDLSLVAQAKILRVLEERRFERLGGSTSIEVDFRLISATNRPLDLFVRESRFREDLFYRVNAFSIRLPSLKERAVDIPVLAGRFIARYCAANGLPLDAKLLSPQAADRLLAYHWPGNIRELESTMSRAALSAPGPVIRAEDIEFLHDAVAPGPSAPGRLPTLRDSERAHIAVVLDAVGWNKLEAARVLYISRGTLYRKIEEYGLEPAATRRRRESASA